VGPLQTLLDRVVGWALGACLGAMTCIVFVSVVFRYVLDSPLAWSEELASLLFAWLTFIGAYVGIRSRSHIRIDTLVVFLPPAVQRWLERAGDLGVLILLLVFAWQGFRLTATTWSLEFPAMEISRGYLYVSLPIAACLMMAGLILNWRLGWEAPTPHPREEKGGP
jgi:TRAP-type C4-dicarboxylate transport system permease small subunit